MAMKNVSGAGKAKAASKPSTVQQVAKRAGITARELRDIVTSVGTYMNASNPKQSKAAKSNIVKQVKETATAATSGKKGTTSDKATIKMEKAKPNTYTKGTQR